MFRCALESSLRRPIFTMKLVPSLLAWETFFVDFFSLVLLFKPNPRYSVHTPPKKRKRKKHIHTHTHTLRERLKKGRDSLYHFPKEGEDSSAIYPHKRRFFGANYQVPCKTQTIGCHTHDMEKCKVFFSFFSSAWIEDILPCHDRGGPM